jgi:hypothetical protein
MDERIRNLRAELETMGVKTEQLHTYWACAEAVKVLGAENVPHILLPDNVVSKTKFLSQRKALHESIQTYKLSIESGAKQRKDLLNSPHAKQQLDIVENRLSAFFIQMADAQHQLYVLLQKTPVDASAFYELLTPKLYELNKLLDQKADQWIQNNSP